MAIDFACTCGKNFSVGDAFAGKRTKCPVCGSGLTVPVPVPDPLKPGTEEDAAFRALMDAPDPEPTAAPVRRERDALADATPRPVSIPAVPNARSSQFKTRSPRKRARRRLPAIHVTPAVLGGIASIVIAVIWFVAGLAAGVIFFYPPVLFFFGLVAVVRGLLGLSED